MNMRLERSGDYWRACWLGLDGKEHRKGLGPAVGTKRATRKPKLSEAAARRAMLDLERRMVACPALARPGSAPTLDAWLTHYLKLRTDLSPRSRKEVEITIGYLKPAVGDARLDRITRIDAAQFRASLAGKMKEQTIRKHMRNCKVIFGKALELDLIAFNPFGREKSAVGAVDKDWAYIDDRTVSRILDACPDDSWRCLIGLCRWAGLRRGEAVRLDWPDIDWTARTLTVRHEGEQTTKRRTRTVPIQPRLYDLLLARFNTAQPGERPYGADTTFDRDFRAILKRAEVKAWSKLFHTLRKNAETDWLAQYPVMDVCQWLGHHPTVAAKHYHQTRQATIDAVTGGGLTARKSEVEMLRARCRRLIEIARALQDGKPT